MDAVYTTFAVIGLTLLLGQFLLSLIGIGHDDVDAHGGDLHLDHVDGLGADHDFSGDHDVAGGHDGIGHDAHDFDNAGAWYVGMLSFRAIVASITIFGLAGVSASRSFHPLVAFTIATAAGLGTLAVVGWIMVKLFSMASDGTVKIDNAIGSTGKVYVRIPAHGNGNGRVTVSVQGRTVEFAAINRSSVDLTTGTPIVVHSISDENLVEVVAAEPVTSA